MHQIRSYSNFVCKGDKGSKLYWKMAENHQGSLMLRCDGHSLNRYALIVQGVLGCLGFRVGEWF